MCSKKTVSAAALLLPDVPVVRDGEACRASARPLSLGDGELRLAQKCSSSSASTTPGINPSHSDITSDPERSRLGAWSRIRLVAGEPRFYKTQTGARRWLLLSQPLGQRRWLTQRSVFSGLVPGSAWAFNTGSSLRSISAGVLMQRALLLTRIGKMRRADRSEVLMILTRNHMF
jgi:hypothetical protein